MVMKRKSESGQAMVEFAYVFIYMMLIILLLIDPIIAVYNHAVGFYTVFKATRQASIFIADGSNTCRLEAESKAYLMPGGPPLIRVDSSNWNLDITPCPNDTSWSPSSGADVVATLSWDQDRIFAFDFHGRSISFHDVFQ